MTPEKKRQLRIKWFRNVLNELHDCIFSKIESSDEVEVLEAELEAEVSRVCLPIIQALLNRELSTDSIPRDQLEIKIKELENRIVILQKDNELLRTDPGGV